MSSCCGAVSRSLQKLSRSAEEVTKLTLDQPAPRAGAGGGRQCRVISACALRAHDGGLGPGAAHARREHSAGARPPDTHAFADLRKLTPQRRRTRLASGGRDWTCQQPRWKSGSKFTWSCWTLRGRHRLLSPCWYQPHRIEIPARLLARCCVRARSLRRSLALSRSRVHAGCSGDLARKDDQAA